MAHVLIAFAATAIGVLIKGILHLSLGETLIPFAVVIMFFYKLFGDRPSFLMFGGILGGALGGFAAIWSYTVIPIQYYYQLWGWAGIIGGVIAVILVPLQLILFLSIALYKGGAIVLIGNFLSGLCFGIAGIFLFNSAFSMPLWRFFSRKKRQSGTA